MRFEYVNISFDDLRGELLSDYLVAVDADLAITDDGREIYVEPYFPVVELARQLAGWVTSGHRADFVFDSLSSDVAGLVTIASEAGGWVVFSALAPHVRSAPVSTADLDRCVGDFLEAVRQDLTARGRDAARIVDLGVAPRRPE